MPFKLLLALTVTCDSKIFPMTSSDKENIVVKMEEDGEVEVIPSTKWDDREMDVLDDVLVKDTAPPGLHDTDC